ncbi:hypothetical protein AB0L47_27355 [Streptomyces bobili]|uniref:hypothetical protein n=1 Tax=Streptomyces bobili TaxID=67280 RepID=UPI003416678C
MAARMMEVASPATPWARRKVANSCRRDAVLAGLNHPWAAIREQDECYSASLIKIAAMYTAFDLRASADQLAIDQGLTTWPAIEAALQATFDPDIATHTPSLINASTDLRDEDKDRRPDYSAVLQLGAPGGNFTVDFTPGQVSAFENMMVQQHDQGATTTSRHLPTLTRFSWSSRWEMTYRWFHLPALSSIFRAARTGSATGWPRGSKPKVPS